MTVTYTHPHPGPGVPVHLRVLVDANGWGPLADSDPGITALTCWCRDGLQCTVRPPLMRAPAAPSTPAPPASPASQSRCFWRCRLCGDGTYSRDPVAAVNAHLAETHGPGFVCWDDKTVRQKVGYYLDQYSDTINRALIYAAVFLAGMFIGIFL